MIAGFDLHSVCACCRDKKKDKDPCVEKPDSDCQHCKVLTPEQLAQLSTLSYKLKKEKRDTKSSTPSKGPSASVTLSPTLVDLAHVLVVGVVDGQSTIRSPGLIGQPTEKKKTRKLRVLSRSNQTSHLSLHLTDHLLLPTPELKNWIRSGRTVSTGWRPFYWQDLLTNHKSLPSLLRRSQHLMAHRPMWSGLNPF